MEGGWRQFEMTDDAFFEPYLLPLTLIEPLNLALLFWILKFKTLQSLEEVPILSRWVHGLLLLVNCCDGRSMVLELFRAIMGIEFDQNKRRKKKLNMDKIRNRQLNARGGFQNRLRFRYMGTTSASNISEMSSLFGPADKFMKIRRRWIG